ncbi:hypothetical protein DDB_G0279499 [Dictyostelium discoideum AX4]|uniref:Uncharacterized protein n=1 Tax=Dictyostelium discoideum TaxID=44689 RepID=Q54WQ4_DICDI|nr:hypothetical protein DDB_G0279499 [Dictyostelium discoideum AX4]EAL67688.1 hypothetical protein DDB_G0279499 [Dictyostelium discoideum AX4]|eukprot:XP_641663.1 hypothetical protein DDB_G0279499 [Dictyostelium discoideum AX4]
MIKKGTTKTVKITSFFVYGTLRPDDNSQAPWTKDFVKGLKFKKAHFRDGILFFDEFPTVSLLYSDNDHYHSDESNPSIKKFDETLMNLYNDNQCNGIVGYLATIDETLLSDTNDIEKLFEEKLKEADIIEEYPEIYKRSIIKVKHLNEDGGDANKDGVVDGNQTQNDHTYCYIYHREDCNRETIIAHGDWVKRNF